MHWKPPYRPQPKRKHFKLTSCKINTPRVAGRHLGEPERPHRYMLLGTLICEQSGTMTSHSLQEQPGIQPCSACAAVKMAGTPASAEVTSPLVRARASANSFRWSATCAQTHNRALVLDQFSPRPQPKYQWPHTLHCHVGDIRTCSSSDRPLFSAPVFLLPFLWRPAALCVSEPSDVMAATF